MPSPISPPADAVAPPPPAGSPGPGELTSPHFETCRGCADVEGSLRIVSWVSDDGQGIVSRFAVGDVHQGAPGILHGGLLVAAFDESMGCAHALYDLRAVTARLDAPDGPVVATALALFLEVGDEHFLRYGREEDLVAAGLLPR